MRDPILNESLRRLATDAATRLSALVAAGDEIPFDVAEHAGPESPFHTYTPLSDRYVRDHEADLVALPSFEPARNAVLSADVASTYLEQRGEPVPADPRERAGRMLVSFLAGLWEGSGEFSLNLSRLDAALAALDAEVRDINDADVLIAPLVGLRLAAARLRLPSGVEIVRADAIDAPRESMSSEGMERRPWEPQFLAVAELGDEAEGAADAMRRLHELISVLRIFKSGGVGLGPYAFAPMGEGRWRRLRTGAGAVRPGGYELDATEAERLVELAGELEAAPDPAGAIAWAVRRFELGCERRSALEGLSDQLLALRALLEGRGPVGASLPMRAAALIDGSTGGRMAARERMEAAQQLERALMRGEPAAGTTDLARWVEDRVREIVRDAALGRLGSDLGSAADSSLIASGLASGDAAAAVAVQEEAPAEAEVEAAQPHRVQAAPEDPQPLHDEAVAGAQALPPHRAEAAVEADGATPRRGGPKDVQPQKEREEDMEETAKTRIMEPVPAEDEIRIRTGDWLEEVEVEVGRGTIEWPATAGAEPHEPIDSPTVRHLFPVPEDADWDVRELEYDHYERRRTG